MQPRNVGSRATSIGALTLAVGLAACGGGGSTAPAVAVNPVEPAATHFSLGLVQAAPAELAGMARIRHALGAAALPAAVDLSPAMPPVGNQGAEGSCVSWASAYALRGYEARQDVWSGIAPKTTDPALNFSPAFVYNQINGGRDAGSTIPAALSFLKVKGAATLADMPYVAGKYTTAPSAAAVANALKYKLSSYGSIAPGDLATMKTQLASGIPVVLAISVYYNLFLLGPGQVYTAVSGAYQGGHAVTIVGYDDSKQAVQIINSWGTAWGSAGYGWIGYAALKQIALEAYSAIDDHGPPILKPSPTPVPAKTPVATPAPVATPTPKATPTLAPAPKISPTASPTVAPTPTAKPSPLPVSTPLPSPTPKK